MLLRLVTALARAVMRRTGSAPFLLLLAAAAIVGTAPRALAQDECKLSAAGRFIHPGQIRLHLATLNVNGPLFVPTSGHSNTVSCLAVSSSGERLATGSYDKTVKVWDRSGRALLTLIGSGSEAVTAVRFSRDGTLLVSGDAEGWLRFWRADTGQFIRVERLGRAPIREIRFSEDDSRLWAVDAQGQVDCWQYVFKEDDCYDSARDASRNIIHPVRLSASKTAFSEDGRFLVVTYADGRVALYSTSSERPAAELRLPTPPTAVAAFNDGSRWVAALPDNTVAFFRAGEAQPFRREDAVVIDYATLKMSADDSSVVLHTNTRLEVFDARGNKPKTVLAGSEDLSPFSVSPDGRVVAAVHRPSGRPAAVRVWRTAEPDRPTDLDSEAVQVKDILFTDGARTIVAACSDDSVKWWDVASGRLSHVARGKFGWINTAALSPNGRYLAQGTGSGDMFQTGVAGYLSLWDLEKGKLLHQLLAHEVAVEQIAFSPDGQLFATRATDSLTRVWDTETAEKLFELPSENYGSGVIFAPGGRRIYVTAGGRLNTYSTADGRLLSSLKTGLTRASVLRLSANSRRLLVLGTAEDDAAFLRVYRIEGDAPIFERAVSVPPRRGAANIFAYSDFSGLATTLDEDALALGFDKGDVLVWLPGASEPLFLPPLSGRVHALGWSPDGRRLAYASREEIGIWDTGTGKEVHRESSRRGAKAIQWVSPDGLLVLPPDTGPMWAQEQGRATRILTPGGAGWTSTSPVPESVLQAADINFRRPYTLHGAAAQLYDARSGTVLATLTQTLPEETTGGHILRPTWLAFDAAGRFDCRDLLSIRDAHWVLPGRVDAPLPLEIFSRDFLTPRLLRRAPDETRRAPRIFSLSNINLARPEVKILDVQPDGTDGGRVKVTVRVSRPPRTRRPDTGGDATPHGLRLFRNGQLVATYPVLNCPTAAETNAPAAEQAGRIQLGPDGSKTVTFCGVQIPTNLGAGQSVRFTAYAFNSDRIRSETAEYNHPPTKPSTPRPRRAYIVSIGVGAFDNGQLGLLYPAKDARAVASVFADSLRRAGGFDEVLPFTLLSETRIIRGVRTPVSKNATRGNIEEVFRRLAGQPPRRGSLDNSPGAHSLRAITPDDLLIIFFSTHGAMDEGEFKLFPTDTGTSTDYQNLIPSSLLSSWLRGIDAGHITLIIESCHAGGAVGQSFKPGPFGDNTFGQLAYDKGMRVLAAAEAAGVTVESGTTEHGLLTYALIEDGVRQGRGDRDRDGRMHMGELLRFAELRVAALNRRAQEAGKGNAAKGVGRRSYLRLKSDSPARPVTFDAHNEPDLLDFYDVVSAGGDTLLRPPPRAPRSSRRGRSFRNP